CLGDSSLLRKAIAIVAQPKTATITIHGSRDAQTARNDRSSFGEFSCSPPCCVVCERSSFIADPLAGASLGHFQKSLLRAGVPHARPSRPLSFARAPCGRRRPECPEDTRS